MSNVRVFSAVQTRRKLLLASTAIALAGYLYAPSVFAADECDPIVSNSVTCTSDGNDYASGIRYETADDLTMVVEDGVTIVTGAGEAIRIDFTGAGDLKLTLYDSDSLTDITTTENEAEGIYVRNAANVVITNEADITTTGSEWSDAIRIYNGADVTVMNSGNLTTYGKVSQGISVFDSQSAAITVSGDIITGLDFAADPGLAGYARGVHVEDTENVAVTVDESGSITTYGAFAHGVGITRSGNGDDLVTVDVSGAIATSGDTSNGVNITDTEGSVKVTASGVVTTYGEYAKGLRVANTTGNASLDVSGVVGTYGAASPAIYVLNTSGEVDIVSTGSVAANGDGSHGISVKGTTVGSVDIDVGGEVSGGSGSGSGIYLNNPGAASSRIDILSGGSLGALSDLAARSVDGALTINNAGAVTGYLVLGGGDDVFNNQSGGVWELRNYIDTDADGERDLEGAAQADFGGGADSFVNDGILRLASVSPAGSQGSLENLEIFTNRGHIDLADGQTGDELAISGEFQSDGGSLAVDVVLDEGTAGADVLVLGAVTMPNLEPTLVYVDNVGGQAGKTAGNGILVVDTSSSVDGAFALGERVISGAYEYLLAEANEDWYLQSSIFEGAAEYPALLSGAFASFHADLAPLHQRLRNVSSADSIPSVEPAGWAGPYDRIGPWLEVVAVKQSVDASASYGQAIAKLIVGLDGELQGSTEGRISLGGFAGFGQTSLEFDESGAESSSDVLLAGLHGSYTLADFYTQAIAKFEHHRGEIEGIAFADGGAPVGVDVAGGSLEAGYLFDTPHLTLSPHARLTYAYAWAEGFDDASGAAIDLKDARSLRGELALRLGKELWQGTSLGSASLELGTRHEFLGEQEAEVSGLTFTDALPGTTAFIAPNLNVELLESSLFLGLRGEYAKGGGSDELSGSLSLNLNL